MPYGLPFTARPQTEVLPYIDPKDPSRQTSYVERYYNQQLVRLMEAKTSRVIAQKSFTGLSAHLCIDTEWFENNRNVKKLPGTPIREDEVKAWVLSQLVVK